MAAFHKEEEDDFDWSPFDDVTPEPMPQRDGDPIFVIRYDDDYKRCVGIYHALRRANEHSERALAICNELIAQCPSNYTAWTYKIEILEDIGYDADFERDLVAACLKGALKCYQMWAYRQWLCDRETEAPDEIAFIKPLMESDPKNFHGWSYMTWFAERWGKYKEVYELACSYTRVDCRNNSAWNVRMATFKGAGVSVEDEFKQVAESLRAVGKNEVTCNVLAALVAENQELLPEAKLLTKELIEKRPDNRHALLLALRWAEDQSEITELCDRLIAVDKLRVPYYELVKSGKIPCR